jgi:hypothetical protein
MHLSTQTPAGQRTQRPVIYAQQQTTIPRRFLPAQSTLALQIGQTENHSVGTSTAPFSTFDYSAPFDYQSYLSRARPDTTARGSQFRSKVVCLLSCKHCEVQVCRRGMKAILLADMNVELFSTDAPPYGIHANTGVQLVHDDYQTRNCHCRIRDVACLGWYIL